MNNERFADLMGWIMVTAMNTAVLASQQQLQRPLTSEEIDACHQEALTSAKILKDGYLDGWDVVPPFGE